MSDSRYTTHLNYSKVKLAFASICHVFGGEMLRSIDPKSDPKYRMIKFNPMQIEGNTLRLPWLASFKRAGKTYFSLTQIAPGISPTRTIPLMHLFMNMNDIGVER